MYGISGCMTLTLPIPTFPSVNLISGQITLNNRTSIKSYRTSIKSCRCDIIAPSQDVVPTANQHLGHIERCTAKCLPQKSISINSQSDYLLRILCHTF